MSKGEFQTTFGTPGSTVSPGQYALDWVEFLGGSIVANGSQLQVEMPIDPGTGVPVQIPTELQALLQSNPQSILAAINGIVYPPGSNRPPPPWWLPFWAWPPNT